MKKIAIFLSMFSVFLFAPCVYANLVEVGDLVSWGGSAGALNGGEMSIINHTKGISFNSFCLEAHINISGNNYLVTDISNNVISGGQGASEPLSGGTKWLFYNWAMGTLPLYNKTNQTQYGQDALQLAIWYLQGDLAFLGSGTFDGTYFYDLALAHLNEGLLLPVYAVNPVGPVNLGGQGDAQSFLVMTPEPLTILLLGASLIGLAGLRRREQG